MTIIIIEDVKYPLHGDVLNVCQIDLFQEETAVAILSVLTMDNVWNVLVCSKCKKYLSFGPTKVYPKGGLKCGRCCNLEDDGTISSYDIIAQHSVFPCVNRFEGCNRLLKQDEVPEHEKICAGGNYECPLCPTKNYKENSVLHLLSHYKACHPNQLLTRPEVLLPIKSCFEDSFAYYDTADNLFIIIYIQMDSRHLVINASTVGNRIGKVKQQVRIKVDGTTVFTSNCEPCTSFGFNTGAFYIELNQFVSEEICEIACELDFDTSDISHLLFTKSSAQPRNVIIENYGTSRGPKFEDVGLVKKFPQIYFPANLPGSKMKSVDDKQWYIWLWRNDVQVHLYCKYCENYCFSERADALFLCSCCHMFTCYLCVQYCQVNNFLLCPLCCVTKIESLQKQCNSARSEILYYCRFEGCLKFFKGDQLVLHENSCRFNEESLLSKHELAKKYFGNYFADSSDESKSIICLGNTISVDGTLLGENGRIYMITNYNFCCMLFYKKEDGVYRFVVAHKYLPDKFYVLVRVVQDGAVKVDANNFSIAASTGAFIVILLKVNDNYKKYQQFNKLKSMVQNTLKKIGKL